MSRPTSIIRVNVNRYESNKRTCNGESEQWNAARESGKQFVSINKQQKI